MAGYDTKIGGQETRSALERSLRFAPGNGSESDPGARLRRSRGSRGQAEVARQARISQGHLSDLERGKKKLTMGIARRLAASLGVSTWDLVGPEYLVRLREVAREGHVDAHLLLEEAERLARLLPDGETGDSIVDILGEIVKGGIAGPLPASPTRLIPGDTRKEPKSPNGDALEGGDNRREYPQS